MAVLAHKGIRVWSAHDQGIRKGIAAKSLDDLKSKIQKKFHVIIIHIMREKLFDIKGMFLFQMKSYYLFLTDGTQIDDDDEYFENLDNQIVLYVSKSDKFTNRFPASENNILDRILHTLREGGPEVVEQIKELVYNNDNWKQMNSFVKEKEAKTNISSRKEDPEWFQGNSLMVSLATLPCTPQCPKNVTSFFTFNPN